MWGCSCSQTIKWLAARGAPHAKSVHEEHRAESTWTVRDWLRHFDEEERFLFPVLPVRDAQILKSQHALFKMQLRTHGHVDERMMQKHAALEDRLVAMMRP